MKNKKHLSAELTEDELRCVTGGAGSSRAAASGLQTPYENIQSAESTYRDADMAKEMTGFTKNNILTQTAQSMLAKANRVPLDSPDRLK